MVLFTQLNLLVLRKLSMKMIMITLENLKLKSKPRKTSYLSLSLFLNPRLKRLRIRMLITNKQELKLKTSRKKEFLSQREILSQRLRSNWFLKALAQSIVIWKKMLFNSMRVLMFGLKRCRKHQLKNILPMQEKSKETIEIRIYSSFIFIKKLL